ncbi:tRNA N6-adenosine threonylcarbamoyltransferase, putative [Plasmodium knowlesi strain H]|uniref:tRNA N6-adenosine threonylcarbamoyltransferase, putative n=2 Tax=Plasmodium knowlesi TaxID=5850 RepID=B3L018_PLAKH|nr:tRNA N6-adenosine threonylcarbamoyltransferase, putative [Plasmodium knowlesi strain H]OTN68460.1 Uncharacterized protein PKNOH_S02299200 [Plasmodium knowlesi]CAA9986497.1 tRNA N6-adenosine threonylcarbamoyltransferase, putative [Plasmodium knowlesi strain H]VVS75971.1 tRNA N6-adenosine threonylcarbamoyltransferase, putative [Plasmodium knowlesi strain H]|eukprot:XP_002261048.1 hypothetical protein, conserved in Plasmodium species [Plasmodium knowlesi strain H]
MKNAIKNLAIYLPCVLSLLLYVHYAYKIDNITIKRGQFSDTLERTVHKINKRVQKDSVTHYDVCQYKKIPKILTERNKFKDSQKVKYIVGIENTCDDTCICILDSNLKIVKNVIISHFKVVHEYEGVYPFFISSINQFFLKPYMEKTLEGIDERLICCFAFSACPGIAKSMEAAKNYIGEKKKQNGSIQVSPINHVFAHVLSPLFFHVYDDKNTYTNSGQYKEGKRDQVEKELCIDMHISEEVRKDKTQMEKVKDILHILNSNDVTKQKMEFLSEDKFLNCGNYVLRGEMNKEAPQSVESQAQQNVAYTRKTTSSSHKTQYSEDAPQRSYLTDGYICALLSGGSTQIYKVQKNKKNDINLCKLSQTVDISIGDIIDKVARLLGLPVGLGGGPFLERKAEEFIKRMKEEHLSGEACADPFQPFPVPFSANNRIDFSFSGIYNHVRKIIEELKKGESFEREKDRYAYFLQKNIFNHLLTQINKIMYFSELHFNVKELFIVGGVGCNNFLITELKNMAMKRSQLPFQLNEFKKLKKRLSKKIKKISEKNILRSKVSKEVLKGEIEFSASLNWDVYLKFLLKRKTEQDILSALECFNFEDFSKLKEEGHFLLEGHSPFSKSEMPWSVHKTPLNLSRDNAAMICFSAFLNLHNKSHIYEDVSQIEIKPTVKTQVENNFLLFSDIIIFDVFLHQFGAQGG